MNTRSYVSPKTSIALVLKVAALLFAGVQSASSILDNPVPPCCSSIGPGVTVTQEDTSDPNHPLAVWTDEKLKTCENSNMTIGKDRYGKYKFKVVVPHSGQDNPLVELRDSKSVFPGTVTATTPDFIVTFDIAAYQVVLPFDLRVKCSTTGVCITVHLDATCRACEQQCPAGAAALSGNVDDDGADGQYGGSLGVGNSYNGDAATGIEFAISAAHNLSMTDFMVHSSGGYTDTIVDNVRIITVDSSQAQISAGTSTLEIDLYPKDNGSFSTQRFRNVSLQNLSDDTLKATITDYASNGDLLSTSIQEWRHPGQGTWEYVMASGMRKTTLERQGSGSAIKRVERRTIRESPVGDDAEASVVVSCTDNTYELTGMQWRKTKEVIDPEGEALVTEWSYYQPDEESGPFGTTYGTGLLKWMRRYDGYEEKHNYADKWHLMDASCEWYTWGRTVTTVWDDSNTETVTVAQWGTPVAKTVTVFGSNSIEERQYTSSSAYLSTQSTFVAPGNQFGGEVSKVVHPDGTVTICGYTRANGKKTVTKSEGVGSSSVTLGRTTVSEYSGKGILQKEVTTAVGGTGNGVVLARMVVDSADWFDRPLAVKYFSEVNGANPKWTEIFTYDCCGIHTQIDRYGITSYYSHDRLGRITGTSRLTVNTETNFIGETEFSGLAAYGLTTEVKRNGAVISRTIHNRANTYVQSWGLSPQTGALVMLSSESTIYRNPGGVPNDTGGMGKRVVETMIGVADDGDVTPAQTNDYLLDGKLYRSTGSLRRNVRHTYTTYSTGLGQEECLIDGSNVTSENNLVINDWAGRVIQSAHHDKYTNYFYYTSNGSNGEARLGKLQKVVDPDSVCTIYDYNTLGERVITCLDVNGNGAINYGTDEVRATESYPAFRGTVGVTRTRAQAWLTASGPTTMSLSDATPDGLQSWSQGPTGAVSNIVTTLSGEGDWLVTKTRDDNTSIIENYVDGLLESATEMDANSNTLASTRYVHDSLQHILSSTNLRTGTTYFTDKHDDDNDPGTPPVRRDSALVTFDGSPLYVEDRGGRVTTYTYDHRGRRTEIDAPDTTVAGGGNLENKTTSHYFPDGSLKEVVGHQTYRTTYTYDFAGRMKTMSTYADGTTPTVTAWIYDPYRGWLLGKRYNYSLGNPDDGPDFTYTNGGRLQARKWVRITANDERVMTTYSYTAGRLTGICYNDNTPSVSLAYDAFGRIQSFHASSGAEIWESYDDQLHIFYTEAQTVMADLGEVDLEPITRGIGWDINPQIPHQRLSSGVWNYDTGWETYIEYGWDQATGQLAGISGISGIFEHGYVAGSPGLVDSVTGPLHKVSNIYEPGRDVLKWKANEDLGTPTNTISKTEYGAHWDSGAIPDAVNGIGQRTKANYSGSAHVNNSRLGTNDYGYNSRGELAQSQRMNGAIPYDQEQFNYDFDGIGNRITATVDEGEADELVHSYGRNALNQYTDIDSLERHYDADGNLDDDGILLYTWDAENRLIAVNQKIDDELVATYDYDPLGRRVRKSTTIIAPQGASQSLYFYDGWNLVAEYKVEAGNVDLLRSYTWGADLSGTLQGAGGVGGLLEIVDYSAETPTAYYTLFDGNGNVTQLITDDGDGGVQLVAHYEYDPFGNLTQNVGLDVNEIGFNDLNPFRFSTKYFDLETRFYYYGYRYYDPVTGRWPSRDPIGEEGGENLYGFVGNDGIDGIDRLGNAAWLVTAAHVKEEGDKFKPYEGEISSTELQRIKTQIEEGIKKIVAMRDDDFNKLRDGGCVLINDVPWTEDKSTFVIKARHELESEFVVQTNGAITDFISKVNDFSKAATENYDVVIYMLHGITDRSGAPTGTLDFLGESLNQKDTLKLISSKVSSKATCVSCYRDGKNIETASFLGGGLSIGAVPVSGSEKGTFESKEQIHLRTIKLTSKVGK